MLKNPSIRDLFDKNLKTPSGVLVNEVELMRFFTMFAKLNLVSEPVTYNAYYQFIDTLERCQQPFNDPCNST